MGTSSNFGNMFSMAGASLFLPFLPMLPTQILLNNLLYDVLGGRRSRSTRRRRAAAHGRVRWDMPLIERFMLVLGPVSSLFDFLTFFALLCAVPAPSEALFQTGWFVESLATQMLVIFVIRTRGSPLRSRPQPALAIALARRGRRRRGPAADPARRACFGFVPPPATFYLFLAAAVAAYLALVEAIKRLFYRRLAPRPA